MLNLVVIQEKNFKKAAFSFEPFEKTGFEIIETLKENTAEENLKLKKILKLIESTRRWDTEVFDLDSMLLCSKIFYKMKIFSNCVEDCEEVLAHDPKCEEAYILIALCYSSISLQQHSKAIEKLKTAKSLIGSTDKIKSTLKKVEESQKNLKSYNSIIDDAHIARQSKDYTKAI